VISPLYRGSVKDLLGPAVAQQTSAVVFEYSDAFSVFDWGRMPDLLPGKGQALAILAADIFEKLEKPDTWKEFSRSPVNFGVRTNFARLLPYSVGFSAKAGAIRSGVSL